MNVGMVWMIWHGMEWSEGFFGHYVCMYVCMYVHVCVGQVGRCACVSFVSRERG